MVVVQGRRVGLSQVRGRVFRSFAPYLAYHSSIVANLIQIICSDAWLELGGSDVENFPGESAGFAHRLLALGIQSKNLGPAQASLAYGYTSDGPVRMSYRLRNGAHRRERIDRADRAVKGMEGICREGIV